MSKNDMVMVPRDLFERWRSGYLRPEDACAIGRIADAPAEQHQGEPVAWVRFRNGEPDYDGDACMIMNVPGDTLGDGDSWEAVYTHADPAETESTLGELADLVEKLNNALGELQTLRADRDAEKSMKATAGQQRDNVTAQLAEAQALLCEWTEMFAGGIKASPLESLETRTLQHLPASAEPSAPKCGNCAASTGSSCNDNGCGYLEGGNGEPSAPVELDERAEFEAWFKDHSKDWPFPSESIKCIARDNDWLVWQARASLARQP